MKTASKFCVGVAGDGRQALAEIASIELDGQTFTAGGAMISESEIIGYVSDDGCELRTWNGERIMAIRKTGERTGFHRTVLKSYAGQYAGRRWHGRGLGEAMILRLRPGKAIK